MGDTDLNLKKNARFLMDSAMVMLVSSMKSVSEGKNEPKNVTRCPFERLKRLLKTRVPFSMSVFDALSDRALFHVLISILGEMRTDKIVLPSVLVFKLINGADP